MSKNEMGKECIIHKKICDMYCTFSKCSQKIICEKCVSDHLEIHPKQFIYLLQNLSEIHSFDKLKRMKEGLGKYKIQNEQRIARIYDPFTVILEPLIERVKKFSYESKKLMNTELLDFLKKNKDIIKETRVQKSITKQIRLKPEKMIQEVIEEVNLINQSEMQIKELTEKYTWYADSTEELCTSAQSELQKLLNLSISLLDTYMKIQVNRYKNDDKMMEGHHEKSFYERYFNTVDIANRGDKNIKEMEIIQARKEVARKDAEVKRNNNTIKEKTTQIQDLQKKIQDLKEEIQKWEQKKEREERERREKEESLKQEKVTKLVKNNIIIDGGQSISMQKKVVDEKDLPLIFEIVPNPVTLILSQHNLSRETLSFFENLRSLQILRMSFMHCDRYYLSRALPNFPNLHTIELNTARIDDEMLKEISVHFPSNLKSIHLMDNEITDDGIESMLTIMKNPQLIESLYLSYNKLTDKTISYLERKTKSIKTLHISKNGITKQGAAIIGRHFKDHLTQLFIGGNALKKQGFLHICRNCTKLRRLSLVATEVTTEIISQILLGLTKLEWLDVSYSNLKVENMAKIKKLQVFNKSLQIISELNNN